MKNLITTPLLIAGAIIMLISFACKKDRIDKKTLNEYNDVSQYLDAKKQEEQEFIIDSLGSGPIVGNQGTRISGAKNCLQNSLGDTIDYPFTIKLVELYKPKDMIYYQMPTVAGGNILETDGEIRLRAFKGAEELTLKPSCPFMIEMPNASPQTYMNIFYGSNSSTFVDWTDSQVGFTVISDGYKAYPNTLGWINCDNQIGNGSGHTLSFTSSTDELQNVGIFIYFTAHDGLMQAYNMSTGLIPDGSEVKIVMIAIDSSGNLFTYNETRTVTASATIDIVLSGISDANLTAYLDAL